MRSGLNASTGLLGTAPVLLLLLLPSLLPSLLPAALSPGLLLLSLLPLSECGTAAGGWPACAACGASGSVAALHTESMTSLICERSQNMPDISVGSMPLQQQ
jgi:hypothetical protein